MKNANHSISLLLVLSGLCAAAAHADQWDSTDDQPVKSRDLTQGSDEAHDLAARPGPLADVDWSRMPLDAYSSYEVTVDGVSSLVHPIQLARFDSSATSLLQTGAAPNGAGGSSRVLEWSNGNSATFSTIRVQGAACGATCGKDAVYRIRAAETTIAIPRYDNIGTKTTTLAIQNLRPTARTITVYFWSHMGVLQTGSTTTFTLPAHGSTNMATWMTTISSGTITVAHDAGYGGLAVKATTTDSSTGNSFDSIGTFKPR
ncbi:MAG: hypothetical protein ABI821_17540 [Pseudomonadota bacterium]